MSLLEDHLFPSTVDWNNKRVQQILDAAAKCFARRGYTDTSIKDIASKVGVTKSMVHYYFSSKSHLLHEVLAYSNQKHLARVTDQLKVTGDHPMDRARQSLKSLWKTVRDGRRFFRLTLEFWSVSARDAKLRDKMRDSHRITRELIQVGIEDAIGEGKNKLPFSGESLAALILAVVHGLEIQAYAEPDGVDVDEAFRMFLASLLAGMSVLDMPKSVKTPAS